MCCTGRKTLLTHSLLVQAYKTFGNRVVTVWKKFEEQRAAIQAAIESPTDEAGMSSSSSVDHDVEDKDTHPLDEDDDAGADDSNDPLPYIGPAFIDEPLNDEDICKLAFSVNSFSLLYSRQLQGGTKQGEQFQFCSLYCVHYM